MLAKRPCSNAGAIDDPKRTEGEGTGDDTSDLGGEATDTRGVSRSKGKGSLAEGNLANIVASGDLPRVFCAPRGSTSKSWQLGAS